MYKCSSSVTIFNNLCGKIVETSIQIFLCSFVIRYLRFRHALPESPPDSGSEPPYSPPGHNDTQHVHSPRKLRKYFVKDQVIIKWFDQINLHKWNCRPKGSSSRNASPPSRESGKLCSKFITFLAKNLNILHGSDAINSYSADISSHLRNAQYSISATANRSDFSALTARA